MSLPTIGLAMIVKNEEAFVSDALASAKLLCDFLTVCDTGSTDRTVDICLGAGASVHSIGWDDSFSAARNRSLTLGIGDWLLILDADERVVLDGVDPTQYRQELRETLHSAEKAAKAAGCWPAVGVQLNVLNKTLDGHPIGGAYNFRLIPNHPDVRYEGRVHNRLCFGSGSRIIKTLAPDGARIDHFGYDASVYKDRRKAERALKLLELELADDPSSGLLSFYMGRELSNLVRFEEAAPYIDRALEQLPLAAREARHGAHAFRLQALLEGAHPAEENRQVLVEAFTQLANEAVVEFPHSADLWHQICQHQLALDQVEEAVFSVNQALRLVDVPVVDHVSVIAYRRWELLELAAICAAKLAAKAGERAEGQKLVVDLLQAAETCAPPAAQERIKLALTLWT